MDVKISHLANKNFVKCFYLKNVTQPFCFRIWCVGRATADFSINGHIVLDYSSSFMVVNVFFLIRFIASYFQYNNIIENRIVIDSIDMRCKQITCM